MSETKRQKPGSKRPGRSSLETNRGIQAGAWPFAGASCLGLGALLAVLLAVPARAQQTTPHIGYVYPAGGRQGTTFQLTLGGQFLEGVSNVFVSGAGVQGKVVDFAKPMSQGEFNRLRDTLRELQDKRQGAFKGKRGASSGGEATNRWTAADEQALSEIRTKILKNPPNRQGTPAIAENVIVRLQVAADAEPGEREIRLGTAAGLSNPLKLEIGSLPEFSEPPARAANPELDRFLERLGRPPAQAPPPTGLRINLPAVVNGQIAPAGVNRYRFHARKGQQIVAAVRARELMPYLADAVPGWFQATLALYDGRGRELAYDDDYRFHPDPVLHYEIGSDGEYSLEIKDAIYRGREDFVYRITVGELPFVTSIFPLGGGAGALTTVDVKGWNLESTTLVRTNETPGVISIEPTRDDRFRNRVPFQVDTLPEQNETEPNDSVAQAQNAGFPVTVNGRIDRPGDQDFFQIEGRAGEDVVAEVYARRLDSPLDSVLRLTDAAGKELAVNDDCEDKGYGLGTHHADSYLRATLPADGVYYVRLGDTQNKGGADYGYRLRISAPRPDFELRVTPSSLNARAGLSVPFTVFALRRDGFSNEISVALKEAPPGFRLSGGRIAAGQDQARMTLTGGATASGEAVGIELEGRAKICGREIVHRAVPAEDMMQAFAYRHLVPVKQLAVAVTGRGGFRAPKVMGESPVKIVPGGTALVRIDGPGYLDRFRFELSDAPQGIRIREAKNIDSGVEILLGSDAGKAKPGLQGNLIVNLVPIPGRGGAGKSPPVQRRAAAGTLPAIAFEIVAPRTEP